MKKKLTDELIRGAFMILFSLAARLVGALVTFIALFQFLCAIIMQKTNGNVRDFGKDLSCYAAEIIQFLSYSTDRKPWPFAQWPKAGPENSGFTGE